MMESSAPTRETAGRPEEAVGERTRARRSIGVIIIAALLIGGGFFFGGFFRFVDTIVNYQTPSPLAADGIVVLTGGAERITGAVELMTAGKARRLLISGVHPDTSASRLGRMVEAEPDMMACCVDLDRRAANTIGNALETAKWARRNGFLSLIVVTSAYHMPRSMLELSHAMPDIRLIPYPVTRPGLTLGNWSEDRSVIVLLLQEYLKYTATRLRLSLGGIDGLADVIGGAFG